MKTNDKKEICIDWKKFGSIELKRLSEEIRTNHSVLNEFGSYIAFCAIDSLFVCIEHLSQQTLDQNIKTFPKH